MTAASSAECDATMAGGLDEARPLLADIEKLTLTLQEAAVSRRTHVLASILQRRKTLLGALHRLVQRGLRLDDGELRDRLEALRALETATETVLLDAMGQLRRSLGQVRVKRNTVNAYVIRPTPGSSNYLDLHS